MAYATLKFSRKENKSIEENVDSGESKKDTHNNKKKKTTSINEELERDPGLSIMAKPLKVSAVSENALTPVSHANYLHATALVPEGQGIAGITAKVVFPDIKKESRSSCCEVQ
jgi:hypothetical protein